MTKSLADIMADKWEEPPEIKLIKDYIHKNYKAESAVSIGPKQINISVSSSSLASSLRMQIYDLQKQLKTDKKLVIKIG